MIRKPRKAAIQRGIEARKPTSSMAVTSSAGRDELTPTMPPMPDIAVRMMPPQMLKIARMISMELPHGHLGHDKANEVPQGIFRPLNIPEGCGGLENAYGEKEDQQAVADALHGVVNGNYDLPHIPALKGLRGLGQQPPKALPACRSTLCRAISKVFTIQLSLMIVHLLGEINRTVRVISQYITVHGRRASGHMK